MTFWVSLALSMYSRLLPRCSTFLLGQFEANRYMVRIHITGPRFRAYRIQIHNIFKAYKSFSIWKSKSRTKSNIINLLKNQLMGRGGGGGGENFKKKRRRVIVSKRSFMGEGDVEDGVSRRERFFVFKKR